MSIYRLRTEMGHYFKWLLLLVVVPIFVIGGVNYFGGSGPGTGPTSQGDSQVIAVVNGQDITRQEFEQSWEQMMDQARSSGVRSALQFADMRVAIFQQLVNERLMLDAAKDFGVEIKEKDIDREVDKLILAYLKENRRAVLGKLDAKHEAMDPRKDSEYQTELSRSGLSIDREIEMAKSRIPRQQVRAQMVQDAVGRRLETRVKPVTASDVTASYRVYRIRQILLQQQGLPKEQLMARASKIVQEARGGTDFAKLVADNSSEPNAKQTGGSAEYSFDTRTAYPQAVRDAIVKLQPGGITPPVETPYGVYIVKLESVQEGVPANLDDKAKQERRKEITQDRQRAVQEEFARDIRSKQDVKVADPEFKAYWHLMSTMAEPGDAAAYKKEVKAAIASLKKAKQTRSNNYVEMQLARLLDQDGQTAEAVRILYPMLEGDDATIEGADLRMLLGDMLLKTGVKEDRERALQQYLTASEVASHDPGVHQQLIAKFKELNRPDLAAKEEAWITEYVKQMSQIQEMRKKQSEGSAPAPQGDR